MCIRDSNRRAATAAALLDVSKAFDKVWHEGLLFKLANSPLPSSIVFFLLSYLSDRTFRVSVDGTCYAVRPVAAGVPQGSVLGPVLYLVYTNDLPVLPGVTLSLFADDAMYHYSSVSPRFASTQLQRQLDQLPDWLRKWRVTINTEKSEAICFTRKSISRCQPLSLEGRPIAYKESVKYLGVRLDRRLCFNAHVTETLAKARGVRAKLYPYLACRSPLALRTKVTSICCFSGLY